MVQLDVPAFVFLANRIMSRNANGSDAVRLRRFRAHFGASPEVVTALWNRLDILDRVPAGGGPQHLLWCLLFMKVYSTEEVLASIVGTSEKTFRKWVWLFVYAVSSLAPDLIRWNRRLPQNHQTAAFRCWTSVDGTDFRIYEPRPFDRGLYSHKFKGPGLRYEVALCIRTGRIVWINGPFKAGNWSDLRIFKEDLIHRLLPGETLVADGTYKNPRCNLPNDFDHPLVAAWKASVRARHETVNRRFKQFYCLHHKFRHHRLKHGIIFRSVAVITQLSLMNGEPLYQIHDA